ncbi:MAG: hypothetical protein QOF21_1325, partial [Actinomycetota bacterium]
MALAATACGARLTDQQLAATKTAQTDGQTAVDDGSSDVTVPSDDGSATDTTLAGSGGPSRGSSTATTLGGTGTKAATTNVHALPAGGNGGATDVGVTATQIALGNVSTLTGPVPGLFAGATVGAQAVVAYENSLGGLFGRKFKLDARDDQFDTGQNRSQTIDLLGKTFGMLGSFSLYDDAAAAQIEQANVPDMSHALGTGRLNIKNNFSIQASVPGGPLGPMNYFKDKNPAAIKAVGSIYSDVPSAVALHQGFKRAAESVGYKYIYERAIGATETDFTSDVVRMRDEGVKMVYLTSVDDKTTYRFAKAMKSQGFKPELFVVNGSGYDADVLKLAGDAAEGMIVTLSTSLYGGEDARIIPEVALLTKWVQNVKPGFTPDIFTAYAWAGGRMLFEAMERVGPKLTRANIVAEVRKMGSFDDF